VIERTLHFRAVMRLLGRFPVVGLLGARQVGKTTLAAAISRASSGERSRVSTWRIRQRLPGSRTRCWRSPA
jgi:predicted AAA+ superfamily ATPase